MIEINLLPWREQARAFKKKRFIFEAGLFLGIVLCMIFIFHFYFSKQVNTQQELISYLQSQINQEQEDLNSMGNQQNEASKIKKYLEMIKNIYITNNLTIELLSLLEKSNSTNVYITKLSKSKNLVILSGIANNADSITLFMQEMSKMTDFKPPVLSAIKQESNNGSRYFELNIEQKGSHPS